MKATRFSGPTLYSDQYPPLEGFPTAFNPDYFQFIDDFDGKVVDTTNYWNFDAISNGTLSIIDVRPDIAAPYDNIPFGMCEISSEGASPALALNSGGTLYSFIQVNPFVRGQSVFYETRLGVNNPKNCDFFTGLVISSQIPNPFDPTANVFRAGFRLVEADGTGKIECVSSGSQTESKVTSFNMPNVIPVYLSSTAGANGNEGPVDDFSTPILGLYISHMAPRTAFAAEYQVFIRYFINRNLVHTAIASVDNPVLQNNVYSSVTSYKKVSNRTGLTLQSDIDNVVEDKTININIPGTENNNGSGLNPGMFFKIGNEFFKVLGSTPSNRVGSTHNVLVSREQLGSSAVTHSIDTPITEDTGSCLIDYSALCINRYPIYPDNPHINSQYLVDGKKTR